MVTTIIKGLDCLTESIGRTLATASLALALITFLVVLMRYAFQVNDLSLFGFSLPRQMLEESVLYLHCLLFMLASGYTLKQDAHVRVDVFYRNFSPRGRALVNLLGTLFLLFPVCVFIICSSLDYVSFSWKLQEKSQESEGLPYIYLLKTLIPLMGVMLMMQGLAEALRNGAILLGMTPPAGVSPAGHGQVGP